MTNQHRPASSHYSHDGRFQLPPSMTLSRRECIEFCTWTTAKDEGPCRAVCEDAYSWGKGTKVRLTADWEGAAMTHSSKGYYLMVDMKTPNHPWSPPVPQKKESSQASGR